ncbi:MAG: DnaB-like helicase N-terminal domain-containing protein [Syntrophaceae bacterium]
MKKLKKPKTAKPAVEASVIDPVHHKQWEVEMQFLATLARVINSDQIDLKNDLLEMRATDFHVREHGVIFDAMKKLADAGEVVDMVTVRAKVGDTCLEALDAVFDGSGAYIGGSYTYKQKILSRSPGR